MKEDWLKKQYESFLTEKGYSVLTPTGSPSTVYDYQKRIDRICKEENLTWAELLENIEYYVALYGPKGEKEAFGRKSNSAFINALRQYQIFKKGNSHILNKSDKNKLSNEFLKNMLKKMNISFIEKPNSFYEINSLNIPLVFKCRTYNNNYVFISKSEIPNLSENIVIALVEWQNEQPVNLYLIPTIEWLSGNWQILKDRNYENSASLPEWGIDINQSNKDELINFTADKILNSLIEKDNKSYIEKIENPSNKETEKQALIKIRLGHSKLREYTINKKKKCEICGLSHSKLLVASHIKPWSKSNNSEKLDYNNMLLLCSMHDALFDKGLISFDDNGKIIISNELDEKERALVNINKDNCIEITSDKQKEYLKYHRENIFL